MGNESSVVRRTGNVARATVDLSQVGVTVVDKLVKIARDGERPIVLPVEFKVFVDLLGGVRVRI